MHFWEDILNVSKFYKQGEGVSPPLEEEPSDIPPLYIYIYILFKIFTLKRLSLLRILSTLIQI